MASSNALCTFAGERLISSARDEIGENRSLLRLEFARFLIVNHGTDKIGRKQIRSELDAMEQRFHGHAASVLIAVVLASPGTPSSRDVSIAEKTDQQDDPPSPSGR
jgi:hypothetical protein